MSDDKNKIKKKIVPKVKEVKWKTSPKKNIEMYKSFSKKK
jgi:hypothetical protein